MRGKCMAGCLPQVPTVESLALQSPSWGLGVVGYIVGAGGRKPGAPGGLSPPLSLGDCAAKGMQKYRLLWV